VPSKPLEILDLWQPVSQPAAADLSFSPAATPEVLRWQLDLPANPALALDRLAGLEAQPLIVDDQLTTVPGRLDRWLEQTPAGLAFSSAAPSPEAELQQRIAELREPVSFAPGQAAALRGVGEQFQARINHLFRLLTNLVWIETRIEGQVIGQTRVGWTGNTRTAWGSDLAPAQIGYHQRNLKVALDGRLIQLRILVLATQAVAKIATLLGSSGGLGTVLVLPLAWNYVYQILNELKTYQE
jgi:hypothetical protein